MKAKLEKIGRNFALVGSGGIGRADAEALVNANNEVVDKLRMLELKCGNRLQGVSGKKICVFCNSEEKEYLKKTNLEWFLDHGESLRGGGDDV
jgi:hypothetical protein